MGASREVARCEKVDNVCRWLGVSRVIFCRWMARLSGIQVSKAKSLPRLGATSRSEPTWSSEP